MCAPAVLGQVVPEPQVKDDAVVQDLLFELGDRRVRGVDLEGGGLGRERHPDRDLHADESQWTSNVTKGVQRPSRALANQTCRK